MQNRVQSKTHVRWRASEQTRERERERRTIPSSDVGLGFCVCENDRPGFRSSEIDLKVIFANVYVEHRSVTGNFVSLQSILVFKKQLHMYCTLFYFHNITKTNVLFVWICIQYSFENIWRSKKQQKKNDH